MTARDMYADLEKIEARGKRKKEKSKGLFSSFGKKDEPEPDENPVQQPQPEPAPATKPVVSEPSNPAPAKGPKPEPAPAIEPVVVTPPKPAPVKEPRPEPPKTAPTPIAQQPAPKPPQVENPDWKPLSGGKLKKAEEDLLAYKKWLNHGYKSGVLTKEQCIDMVLKKEMELGLKPPKT